MSFLTNELVDPEIRCIISSLVPWPDVYVRGAKVQDISWFILLRPLVQIFRGPRSIEGPSSSYGISPGIRGVCKQLSVLQVWCAVFASSIHVVHPV